MNSPSRATPRVYIVQESDGKDLSPARKFGELKVLLPIGRQVTITSDSVVETLRTKLRGFGSRDHLLLLGDPISIGIATALALEENKGRCNVLKWDRRNHCYESILVDLNQ